MNPIRNIQKILFGLALVLTPLAVPVPAHAIAPTVTLVIFTSTAEVTVGGIHTIIWALVETGTGNLISSGMGLPPPSVLAAVTPTSTGAIGTAAGIGAGTLLFTFVAVPSAVASVFLPIINAGNEIEANQNVNPQPPGVISPTIIPSNAPWTAGLGMAN